MGGANNVVTWMPKTKEILPMTASYSLLQYYTLLLSATFGVERPLELPSNINVYYYQTAKKRGVQC